MARTLNFILGLLIGSIIGVAAVLLITPYSGDDVKRQTKEQLDSILEEGRKAFAARKAELETRMADIQTGKTRL